MLKNQIALIEGITNRTVLSTFSQNNARASFTEPKVYEEKYKNGQYKVLIKMHMGNLTEYREWYKNGNDKYRYLFFGCDTQLTSPNTSNDNQLRKVSITGEFTEWYENASKRRVFLVDEQCNFIDEYHEWYISITDEYDEENMSGKYVRYGMIYDKFYCIYINGKRVGFCYKDYPGNRKKIACFYENGLFSGKFMEWHKNSIVKKTCFYDRGLLNGKYEKWWNNGNKRVVCHFSNGKFTGKYETWWRDGNKHIDCSYSLTGAEPVNTNLTGGGDSDDDIIAVPNIGNGLDTINPRGGEPNLAGEGAEGRLNKFQKIVRWLDTTKTSEVKEENEADESKLVEDEESDEDYDTNIDTDDEAKIKLPNAKKGMLHGTYREWDEDGSLKVIRVYVKGRLVSNKGNPDTTEGEESDGGEAPTQTVVKPRTYRRRGTGVRKIKNLNTFRGDWFKARDRLRNEFQV